MSAQEWEWIFRSFAGRVYWLTVTGGETFLRHDLAEVVRSALRFLRPRAVTLPTNGSLRGRVVDFCDKVIRNHPRVQFIVNFSVDGPRRLHDEVRGREGNYDAIAATMKAVRSLGLPNLIVGVGSTLSKFNVARHRELYEAVVSLHPDSFVAEAAQNRKELFNMTADITPEPGPYLEAVSYLTGQWEAHVRRNGCGGHDKSQPRLVRFFKRLYHPVAAETLRTGTQVLPCYAGVGSAHIASDGTVWECCVDATPMGNLREAGYDFPAIWRSTQARRVRAKVKSGACACPMGNVSYLNILMSPAKAYRAFRARR